MRYILLLSTYLMFNNFYSQIQTDFYDNPFRSSLIMDGIGVMNGCEYIDTLMTMYRKSEVVIDSTIVANKKFYFSFQLEYIDIINFDYKLLHFKSYNDSSCEWGEENIDAYFRVFGYKENDFHHFYNRVLKYFWKENDIDELLSKLNKKDSIFGTVDFEGLIFSVENQLRNINCMQSFALKHCVFKPFFSGDAQNKYKENYLSENTFAYYSNRPLLGGLPKKLNYNEHIKYIYIMNKYVKSNKIIRGRFMFIRRMFSTELNCN